MPFKRFAKFVVNLLLLFLKQVIVRFGEIACHIQLDTYFSFATCQTLVYGEVCPAYTEPEVTTVPRGPAFKTAAVINHKIS